MILFNGVTIDGEAPAKKAARSTLAGSRSSILWAMTRDELASRRRDCRAGIRTLSSDAPLVEGREIVVSLPMTCAHTMETASTMTGLTLPGMIEEPGCRSGMNNSPRPVFGPDPIQRRSLLIFSRE